LNETKKEELLSSDALKVTRVKNEPRGEKAPSVDDDFADEVLRTYRRVKKKKDTRLFE
jgi:hypothetical protein